MPAWLILGLLFLWFWSDDEHAQSPPAQSPALIPAGKVPLSPGMFVAGGTVNGGQAGQTPMNVWGTIGIDTTVGSSHGVARY
jgi:hypothetical protein